MRVRSPIGDLPFVVTRVRRDGREVVVQGEIGTWPSEVRIAASDVPMLARSLPREVRVGAAAVLMLAVCGGRAARRHALRAAGTDPSAAEAARPARVRRACPHAFPLVA